MNLPEGFKLLAEPARYRPETGFVARLSGKNSKTELLSALSAALHLPEYFGLNWDALFDCLLDLSWLNSPVISLVHEGPVRLSSRDLSIYIDLLRHCLLYTSPSPRD